MSLGWEGLVLTLTGHRLRLDSEWTTCRGCATLHSAIQMRLTNERNGVRSHVSSHPRFLLSADAVKRRCRVISRDPFAGVVTLPR
jgi:hypothetical protein